MSEQTETRGIFVDRAIILQMMEECRRDAAIECCGLLAGHDGTIAAILPASNAFASATAYEIAPEELFRLFRDIRAQGMELLGIYHSHPKGDNAPSPADIERAFYPETAYFIISPAPNAPRPVRAFHIRGGTVTELLIEAVGV